jgi:hypothetical protein
VVYSWSWNYSGKHLDTYFLGLAIYSGIRTIHSHKVSKKKVDYYWSMFIGDLRNFGSIINPLVDQFYEHA